MPRWIVGADRGVRILVSRVVVRFVTQSLRSRHKGVKSLKLHSDHCHPAIDMEGLASDVSGLIAGEINHRRGDFVALPHAA